MGGNAMEWNGGDETRQESRHGTAGEPDASRSIHVRAPGARGRAAVAVHEPSLSCGANRGGREASTAAGIWSGPVSRYARAVGARVRRGRARAHKCARRRRDVVAGPVDAMPPTPTPRVGAGLLAG
jgi:hypothetical protein